MALATSNGQLKTNSWEIKAHQMLKDKLLNIKTDANELIEFLNGLTKTAEDTLEGIKEMRQKSSNNGFKKYLHLYHRTNQKLEHISTKVLAVKFHCFNDLIESTGDVVNEEILPKQTAVKLPLEEPIINQCSHSSDDELYSSDEDDTEQIVPKRTEAKLPIEVPIVHKNLHSSDDEIYISEEEEDDDELNHHANHSLSLPPVPPSKPRIPASDPSVPASDPRVPASELRLPFSTSFEKNFPHMPSLPAASIIPVRQKILHVKPKRQNIMPVYVGYIKNPGDFWIALDDKLVENINYKVQIAVKNSVNIKTADKRVEVGSYCAARYSHDDYWYRAYVIDVNYESKAASIFYIDYGNYAEVPFIDMIPLPEELYRYTAQAIHCMLNSVGIPGAHWDEEVIEQFRDVMANGHAVGNFFSPLECAEGDGNLYGVEIFVGEDKEHISNFLDLDKILK